MRKVLFCQEFFPSENTCASDDCLLLRSPMEIGHLRELFANVKKKRFLVVGDLMLDRYCWGHADRLSPEAPVPVVSLDGESEFPGGAANVARNLRDFVGSVDLIGVIGEDENGDRLLRCLIEAGLEVDHVIRETNRKTTTKTRIVSQGQQVVRIDRESTFPVSDEIQAEIRQRFLQALPNCDGIIFQDYAKGLFNRKLANDLIALAAKSPSPLCVDPNPRNRELNWDGVSSIKLNLTEALAYAQLEEKCLNDNFFTRLSEILKKKFNCGILLLTLGADGMTLLNPLKNGAFARCSSQVREVFDVSGAGDTAIAHFALALVAGEDPEQAMAVANLAAGVVVGKKGTASATLEELENAFLKQT